MDGPLPDCRELAARLASSEEQLERVSKQLSERDLVLIELTNLADHLSFQAAERYPEALVLSHQVMFAHACLQVVSGLCTMGYFLLSDNIS